MRVIAVGCEYCGVTCLLDGLLDWVGQQGIDAHLDDHFSIPDRYHLGAEDQQTMVGLSPVLKERFQRMQLVYHIRLLHRYEDMLLGGFHIEEAIYGPRYYYPGGIASEIRNYEAELPADTMLVHLFSRPEVVEARMERAPRDFNIIQKADIPELLAGFRREYESSLLTHKFEIDTSELSPQQLLETFLKRSVPHLTNRDLILRTNEGLGG